MTHSHRFGIATHQCMDCGQLEKFEYPTRDGLRDALQACERYLGNLVDEDTPSCALLLGRVRSALAALPGKETNGNS